MTALISEKYRRMQEKFQLPHLNDLASTFKIELESDEQLFEQIRMEMSERLFSFTERIIEPLIAGGDSFCCVFEQDMITEIDRKRLFSLYRKLQVLKWENNLLMVQPNERKTMGWIRKTWKLWNSELESELTNLCEHLSASWENFDFKETQTDYHG